MGLSPPYVIDTTTLDDDDDDEDEDEDEDEDASILASCAAA